MIISQEAEIRVDNSKLKLYKMLGYENIKQGDTITIDIKYLSPNSRSIIDVKCDYCKSILKREYRVYRSNIKNENKFCCKKCTPIRYSITCLEKYGVDNTSKLPRIHDKIKETCLERYGNENYRNTEQRYKTILNRDGGYSKIISKYKQTCLERFGVENATQNKDVFSKQQKKRHEINKYKDTGLFYQGTYEKDFLEKYYDRIEIVKIESIDYVFENKNKKYYSDYYLPKYNLIIEIKSSYTYDRHREQNIMKKETCIDLGYKFLFITNKNYSELEIFLNDC